MEDNKIVDLAIFGIVGLVVAPIVIGTAIRTVNLVIVGVGSISDNIKYKKKIKNGLKDGSIVEIDGHFYEVETDEA